MKADFLYNPHEIGANAHCATYCELPNGRAAAAWYGYPGSEEYLNARIVFTVRESPLADWRKAQALFPQLKSSAGNPVLYFDEKEGTLILFFVLLKGTYWTDAVLHYSVSANLGVSWSEPAPFSAQRGLMARSSAIRNIHGDWILPLYDEHKNSSLFMQQQSGSWKMISELPEKSGIQPALIHLDGKRIISFFRPVGEPRIISRRVSSDDGHSWSPLIPTTLPCPLSGFSAFTDGTALFIVYNHTDECKRTPLSISYSSDMGVTWSSPYHLDSVNHELSYPSFILAKDGLVHGLYTYNRRMIKYLSFSLSEIGYGA